VSLVVIGGGQAGLAVSSQLLSLGVEHVVLERDRVAETWRRRWDSFHLVTPNWTLSLPGAPYDGDDPEGFVARDEIVAYLERYAAGLPVRTGVAVNSVEPADGAGFLLRTSDGDLSAEAVIICTGAYQRPHRPTFGGRFPPEVTVLDAEGCRLR
jgi:putative flavoprotein involved in K+ transport